MKNSEKESYPIFLLMLMVLFLSSSYGQVQVGENIEGQASMDLSGYSTALSLDGSRLAVGAPQNDENGFNSGHVRIYELLDGSWIQLGSDIIGESIGDNSGSSVSLSFDGARVAIGAPLNSGIGLNAGHVRIYEWSGD